MTKVRVTTIATNCDIAEQMRAVNMEQEQKIDDLLERQRLRHLNSPFVSIEVTAELVGVTVRTLRRWQAAGQMPPRAKSSRRYVYDKSAIASLRSSLEAIQTTKPVSDDRLRNSALAPKPKGKEAENDQR